MDFSSGMINLDDMALPDCIHPADTPSPSMPRQLVVSQYTEGIGSVRNNTSGCKEEVPYY